MLHHQHVEKEPGEQPSGFFFTLIPDTFSERTNQFQRQQLRNGAHMPLGTILLIILVILLIGALPAWPYAAAWGPAPAGILGFILVVVLILVLLGRI
jgi:protein-S-isoprenylcysteine O-methyltransferase Ste14